MPSAPGPGGLEPLGLLERRDGPVPGVEGGPGHAPGIDPLPLGPGHLKVGSLGGLPGGLGTTPDPAEDASGSYRRVEGVEAVLPGPGRRRSRRRPPGKARATTAVIPRAASEMANSRAGGRGRVPVQGSAERSAASTPRRRPHARRLEGDQGRSPPEQASSTARGRRDRHRPYRSPPGPSRTGPAWDRSPPARVE